VTAPPTATRIPWRTATVASVAPETARTRTVVFDVPGWPGHRPGQHVDVRLTADDGYQTERSYSIASAPNDARLALTVERLDDGEVSPYLTEELRAGDQIELRGPIGGYFVWDIETGGPLFLVGGGSGIVPLMAMVRHRHESLATAAGDAHSLRTRLLYSSRAWDEIIYRDELAHLAAEDHTLEVVHTLTRSAPEGWSGFRRRIDKEMLGETAWPARENPRVFVCGPTPLVESVAGTLVELGHQPALVKTERFGPTGSVTPQSTTTKESK
jgi:ferredoxin-NADP reductase